MKYCQSTLFLPLVFFLSSCILGCKNKKEALFDSMIKLNVYEAGNTYRDSGVSPQWRNYQEFIQTFSDSELVKFCDYQNPVVRTYAFRRLFDKRNSDVFKILLKHLSDTSSFLSIQGCLVGNVCVNDTWLEMCEYEYISSASMGVKEWKDFYFTKAQYDLIDSVLLFQDAIRSRDTAGILKSRFHRYLFYRLDPIPTFHDRVYQIVTEGVYEALPLLARYKNAKDTTILKEFLKMEEKRKVKLLTGTTIKISAREAIVNFPHPCFYPILKEKVKAEIGNDTIPDKDESYLLYLAIVQYPTHETKELLEVLLKRFDAGHYNRSAYINDALEKYPSKIFDGLKLYITNTHM